ncbi:MAG TPA: L,D-transpeptidase [Candidatus Hydrogenedentes bacterium]|nr:L,D-transpeptidase [Candidatus Hydrogenedentota bacterium]HIJ74328.1 L,D-transpeptidase [Candidatus Hydrogenedentota bacterium]
MDDQAKDSESTHALFSEDQPEFFDTKGWTDHVRDGLGLWVSVDEQKVRAIRDGAVVWEAPCSTSSRGTGQRINSNKTPLGWHTVTRKVGADAPWGQVFRAQRPTAEIWQPGTHLEEDLVLTRILLLSGDEPGFNQGGEVDSAARCIYVHGTNEEERIGVPASHGCIRLRNDDVIALFELIPEGTPLLITERGGPDRPRP